MRTLLATIAEGEADLADLFFLVALILFIIVAVIRAMARSLDGTLVAAGAASLALAWLLL